MAKQNVRVLLKHGALFSTAMARRRWRRPNLWESQQPDKKAIYNIRTYCIVYGYSAPRYYKIGPGVAAGDGGGGGREDAKRTGGERPTRTNS